MTGSRDALQIWPEVIAASGSENTVTVDPLGEPEREMVSPHARDVESKPVRAVGNGRLEA